MIDICELVKNHHYIYTNQTAVISDRKSCLVTIQVPLLLTIYPPCDDMHFFTALCSTFNTNRMGTRCFWDSGSDNSASDTYMNVSYGRDQIAIYCMFVYLS